MTIRLQRLNVVRIVDSEDKAKALEQQGFQRIENAEREPEPAARKGKKTDDARGGD